jgi:hypothetical protein
MKEVKQKPPDDVPVVTKEQLAELKAKLAFGRLEPALPTGTVTICPNCGGRMLTTNDLERTIATPGLVYVIARLPGARCLDCESMELDGAGVAILGSSAPREMIADYETAVTHSSGTTLGTYFKMDLARVLGLSGSERLLWKVVDRDNVLVQVNRTRKSGAKPTGVSVQLGNVVRGKGQGPKRRRKPTKSRA